MPALTKNKLKSVFGSCGFELKSATLPYIPSDCEEHEYEDVLCLIPLPDLLTSENLAKITDRAEKSVSQANRRLRNSIKPYFPKKARFKFDTPAEKWALSVWVKLDRQPRSGRYLISARASVDTSSSLIFLLTETSWCQEEDVDAELALVKTSLNAILSSLYETILEKVDIDKYAASAARTVNSLPLSYVFDAVKPFSVYPNSIPEKLNMR